MSQRGPEPPLAEIATPLSSDRRLSLLWLSIALLTALPLLLVLPRAGAHDSIPPEGEGGPTAVLARSVASLYVDDAFYYLTIAKRWSQGEPSTFDGLHLTNGYQPLWLVCLLPLALVTTSSAQLVLSSFAVQALATALIAVLTFRAARCFAGPLASSAAALAWIRLQHTYFMHFSGMEYALNALTLAALALLMLVSHRDLRPPRLLLLGTLAALCFLARIDNLLLVVLLGADLTLRAGWRRLSWYVAPVAAVVGAYLVINVVAFGHPLPVSGAVKASWSAAMLEQDAVYVEHGWLAAKLVNSWRSLVASSRSWAVGLILGPVAALAMSWRVSSPLRPLRPMAAHALLQVSLYAVVYHGGHSRNPWYYAVQPLVTALVVAGLLALGQSAISSGPRLRRAARLPAVLLIVLLGLSTALNSARFRRHRQSWSAEPLVAAAAWARRELPQEAVIGAWNAGILAYFGGRRVVNLDGLVNSWSFFNVESGQLCRYLDREGVTHLVDAFPSDSRLGFHRELASCLDSWRQVWVGPRYERSGGWQAAAYRRRPE